MSPQARSCPRPSAIFRQACSLCRAISCVSRKIRWRKSLDVNSDSIRGATLQCKTNKPHGLDWPRARPRMGMTGTIYWGRPILDFRTAYARARGSEPTPKFPRISRKLEIDSAESTPYSTTRRKLALLCAVLGAKMGCLTRYTPRQHFPNSCHPGELQHSRVGHRRSLV